MELTRSTGISRVYRLMNRKTGPAFYGAVFLRAPETPGTPARTISNAPFFLDHQDSRDTHRLGNMFIAGLGVKDIAGIE